MFAIDSFKYIGPNKFVNQLFYKFIFLFLIVSPTYLSGQSFKDTSMIYARFAIGAEIGLSGFGGFESNGNVSPIPLNSGPFAGAVFSYSPRHGLLSFSLGLRWQQIQLWRNYHLDNRSKGAVSIPHDIELNFLRRKKIGFTLQYGNSYSFYISDHKYCSFEAKKILNYWESRLGGTLNIKLNDFRELRIHLLYNLFGDPWEPRCSDPYYDYEGGIEIGVNFVKRFGLWSWNDGKRFISF